MKNQIEVVLGQAREFTGLELTKLFISVPYVNANNIKVEIIDLEWDHVNQEVNRVIKVSHMRDETAAEVYAKKEAVRLNALAFENQERVQLRLLLSKYPDEFKPTSLGDK